MGFVPNQTPPSLSRSAPSFRLRNQSLDNLRLRRVFDLFDSNHDGEITSDELYEALNVLGLVADKAEISSTVAAHRKPGRSGLDYDDFQGLHRFIGDSISLAGEPGEERSEAEQEEEDLTEAFRVFDEDGDGFISAAELQSVLMKLHMREASEMGNVDAMIWSVDKNGDGRVDLGEFKNMMRDVHLR